MLLQSWKEICRCFEEAIVSELDFLITNFGFSNFIFDFNSAGCSAFSRAQYVGLEVHFDLRDAYFDVLLFRLEPKSRFGPPSIVYDYEIRKDPRMIKLEWLMCIRKMPNC